jgi:2-C-methyl-D-erythritol 4-phosphate cytidylyltransferase/2-C-methyl-D-erythritol 2,4-cyclodiphosphate synthase
MSSADLTVILPAGGSSVRFGRDKLMEHLGGKTVIERAIAAFLQRTDVARIVIATKNRDLGGIANNPKVVVCEGGASRAESVRNALLKSTGEWVAVHDAARPMVSQGLIDRVFAAAREYGAAVPALPVHLTIKQATGPLPARVERTVPRATLWAMQTPQVMRRTDLLAAYEQCPIPLEQVTDDVQLLEMIGREVWLVEGEQRNVKVTTEQDLWLAERWLNCP